MITLQNLTSRDPRFTSEDEIAPEDIDACVEHLKHHDVVLKELEPWSCADKEGRIACYLELNEYGRRTARTTTECGVIVNLLSRVPPCGRLRTRYRTVWRDEARVASTLYGLLREAPGSWCQPTPSTRKRKRTEA